MRLLILMQILSNADSDADLDSDALADSDTRLADVLAILMQMLTPDALADS